MIWFYGGNIEKNEKWFVLLLNHINIICHISNNHIVKKNIFQIKMRLFIWKSYKNMMANRGRLDKKEDTITHQNNAMIFLLLLLEQTGQLILQLHDLGINSSSLYCVLWCVYEYVYVCIWTRVCVCVCVCINRFKRTWVLYYISWVQTCICNSNVLSQGSLYNDGSAK